jgi:hypothetical protein
MVAVCLSLVFGCWCTKLFIDNGRSSAETKTSKNRSVKRREGEKRRYTRWTRQTFDVKGRKEGIKIRNTLEIGYVILKSPRHIQTQRKSKE